MDSTDRDKAREVIGNVNNYAEDNGELSISAFGPLTERITTALAEARRETWEAAIDRINKRLGRYVMVRGPEVDVMRTVCNQIIGEFESAKEKETNGA